MNLLGHIERWLHRHALDFDALPLTSVASAAVTDEDTAQWSDMRYMRELVDEIAFLANTTHGAAPLVEDMLDRPVLDDCDELHHLLAFPADVAATELEAWRVRLLMEKRFAAWWLARAQMGEVA